ncbi:hypothetical protein Emag_004551 [Eimeria magna]
MGQGSIFPPPSFPESPVCLSVAGGPLTFAPTREGRDREGRSSVTEPPCSPSLTPGLRRISSQPAKPLVAGGSATLQPPELIPSLSLPAAHGQSRCSRQFNPNSRTINSSNSNNSNNSGGSNNSNNSSSNNNSTNNKHSDTSTTNSSNSTTNSNEDSSNSSNKGGTATAAIAATATAAAVPTQLKRLQQRGQLQQHSSRRSSGAITSSAVISSRKSNGGARTASGRGATSRSNTSSSRGARSSSSISISSSSLADGRAQLLASRRRRCGSPSAIGYRCRCHSWGLRLVQISSSSSSSSKEGLLSVADLCDSAAEYMEGLVSGKSTTPGSIYSGDAGVAYLLIRKAERYLAQAEAEGRATAAAKETDGAAAAAAAAPEDAAAAGAAAGAAREERETAGSSARRAAERALKEALSLLTTEQETDEAAAAERSLRRRYTFLQGHDEAFITLRRLAAAAAAAASRLEAEACELLYGRAGLLYALLFTRLLWLPSPPDAFSQQDDLQQQQQQQQLEPVDLFGDCHEVKGDSSSSSSSSGSSMQQGACFPPGSSTKVIEGFQRGSSAKAFLQCSSIGSGCGSSGKGFWPLSSLDSFSSVLLRRRSSSSSTYGSSRYGSRREDLGLLGSQGVADEREATRVLLLALVAELVGQLVAQGRAGAVVSEAAGISSLDTVDSAMQPAASAAAAFAKNIPLPLVYEWHGKEYLGAAHGLCGVLLQLLQAVDTLYYAALCGCFPGPAGPAATAASESAAAAAAAASRAPEEEAEAAAARLLACAPAVCTAVRRGSNESSVFCAAASAFLCCCDPVAAAASLRGSVRRLSLVCLCVLLRNHMTESYNLKSSIGSTRDVLVQWCHGAPGLLPLLCWAVDAHKEEAVQQQQQQQQLQLLQQQGSRGSRETMTQQQEQRQEVTGLYRRRSRRDGDPVAEDLGFFFMWLDVVGQVAWRRGLLTKGLGVCHGIGGNGLSMLAAFRSSQQPRWLRRALLFALEGLRRHQQLLPVPDRPFSLFEGAAGFALFLRDCAEALRIACCADTRRPSFYFPAYELPPLPSSS